MFKIFRGNWRGINERGDDEIFVNIGVSFREHLHHFKGAKLHVFLAITLHMDKDGHAFPSYGRLQKETGYGRDTIARALDELCDTKIEGQPVLMRWRERDDKGKFTGSNHYIIFPTDEEQQDTAQSPENPTLEKPNSGEPDSKDSHDNEEKPVVAAPNCFAFYEQNIGPLTPHILDTFNDYLEDESCTEDWITDAIREAVDANVRKLSYVRRVLDSWIAEGRNMRDVRTNGAQPTGDASDQSMFIGQKVV